MQLFSIFSVVAISVFNVITPEVTLFCISIVVQFEGLAGRFVLFDIVGFEKFSFEIDKLEE